MKRLIHVLFALTVSFGALGQQEHYYQVFSIGECNNDIEINLTPLFESTPDVLVLSLDPFEADSFHYHLFNMHGVSMRTGKVVYNRTEILMADYPTGSYHLLISTDEEDIQLFRTKKKVLE